MLDRCLISFVILAGAPLMNALAVATQQAQPAQPTVDIRQQRARAFIDAINADDPAGYVQYMATNRTPQSAAAATDAQRRDQFLAQSSGRTWLPFHGRQPTRFVDTHQASDGGVFPRIGRGAQRTFSP